MYARRNEEMAVSLTPEVLSGLRKAAGLKYSQLAEITGYTRGYLCNLEKGQRPITLEAERRLLAYFEHGSRVRPVKISHHRDERGRFTSGTYQAGD